MSEPFEPRNELERQLIAAQQGEMAPEAFMQALLVSQVFLPARDESTGVMNLQRSDRATLLTVEADDGTKVVVVFTSPERAKPFLANFPGYTGGLLTEFKWLLERVGVGVGVALNPGWETGLDMEPEMIQQLRGQSSRQ